MLAWDLILSHITQAKADQKQHQAEHAVRAALHGNIGRAVALKV